MLHIMVLYGDASQTCPITQGTNTHHYRCHIPSEGQRQKHGTNMCKIHYIFSNFSLIKNNKENQLPNCQSYLHVKAMNILYVLYNLSCSFARSTWVYPKKGYSWVFPNVMGYLFQSIPFSYFPPFKVAMNGPFLNSSRCLHACLSWSSNSQCSVHRAQMA